MAPPEHDLDVAIPPEPLTVLIVNWRRERATLETVEALSSWSSPPRVIVVDNGSGADVLSDLAAALPSSDLVVNESNVGFGAAHNVALEGVNTPSLLLLNNDARLDEPAAAKLQRFLDERSDAGIVGPLLRHERAGRSRLAAGGRDIALHARTHSTASERREPIEAGEPFEVDYVPGTAALVRTDLLRRVGGFHEEYFFAGEMADLCWRVRQIGFGSWIVPSAIVDHDLEAAGSSRETLYRYYALRNRFLYVGRCRPEAERAALRRRWTLRGLLQAAQALVSGHLAGARSLAAAVADGRAGRFGRAPESVPR